MGRIKTQLLKRITNKIIRDHKDKVKDNFEDNKKVVTELADIPSKKHRNIIAGYVTRKNRA
ncbi:MAG: 30S ribosomal protein S17e [Candidatus Woesearchaeota archaeon]|jgi:small subunit ribosomal protein S17e|nr:30S ribosomal protein S17e [Candidatus Woesearchaeota archaeon]MDP7458180.1 30S ribosomal protein S17e [Candidatus Woesearchaeota archaeon]